MAVEDCRGFLELLAFMITPSVAILECLANISWQFGQQTLESLLCMALC